MINILTSFLLFTSSLITFDLDLVMPNGLEHYTCDSIVIDNSVLQYDLANKKISIAANCTTIFRDGFED